MMMSTTNESKGSSSNKKLSVSPSASPSRKNNNGTNDNGKTSTSSTPTSTASAGVDDNNALQTTTPTPSITGSDITAPRSGGGGKTGSGGSGSKSKKKKKNRVNSTNSDTASLMSSSVMSMSHLSLEEQLAASKEQVNQEKAGKRKLFHSLVKLANELRKTRDESFPLLEQRKYADKNWYEGGLWRAPALLPGVYRRSFQTARLSRETPSLTDLFFGLTIVTAFTRVGVAISKEGFVDINSLLYFAVFWTVWGKEAGYSTRFDTTDVSAQAVTLVTCFAVLFASLSVQQPIASDDGGRVMIMAAFVAGLHLLLHVRVLVTVGRERSQNVEDTERSSTHSTTSQSKEEIMAETALQTQVMNYAVFNIGMCFVELLVWLVGVLIFAPEWPYRWLLFVGGIVLAIRVPRAMMPNDFHAACAKRGVLFILLLGFLLQSIIVVASEFFTYQTPSTEHYAFIGAACLMLFCMKLLYADDSSDTLAEDHALLVNNTAAFFFNMGNFVLLLSTTILGSGLNLLTHDYLSAIQALPGPSKSMVCGGFAAVLFSTFFCKSLHLKRVPDDGRGQCFFITAYLMQAMTLLAVVGVSAAMAMGKVSGALAALMESDILLLFALSVAALVVVVMHWLDEGVELALYGSSETGRSYRVHPFGFWWCLKPDESRTVYNDEASPLDDFSAGDSSEMLFVDSSGNGFLGVSSETSPLLAPSFRNYKSTGSGGELV